MTSVTPVDILCFGEPMFEFSWIDKDTIHPGIGGDAANTAVAAHRAGATAGVLTHLGTDGFGDHILEFFAEEGLDTSRVQQSEAAPTGLYFIEYGPDGHRFSYRRAGSAASQIQPGDFDENMFNNISFLHFSGITQAISPSSCAASLRAAELARNAGARVSFDTNLRLNLWTAEKARAAMLKTLPLTDIVFPSVEDAEALLGTTSSDEICDYFLNAGVDLVVLTLGEDGAVVADKNAVTAIDPVPAKLVDATGAGDTFDGAFLAEMSRGSDPVTSARFACAAASRCVEHVGAMQKRT